MLRHAFTMQLKPGYADEYRRRHDAVWPELAAELTKAGITDYSIFLDEPNGTLFAVQKIIHPQAAASLSESYIMQKWWDYMADIMNVNPDNFPIGQLLTDVFHLD